LQVGAEGLPRAAHVFQGREKDVGAREAAGALRKAAILDPPGVAVVDDPDAGGQRGRNDLALVHVGEIGRDLDDEWLGGRLADLTEHRGELTGLPAPLGNELGVWGGDV